jgi:hypothetical protein
LGVADLGPADLRGAGETIERSARAGGDFEPVPVVRAAPLDVVNRARSLPSVVFAIAVDAAA